MTENATTGPATDHDALDQRPRRNADQTRARILEAAEAEFARLGLGGARVGAIAERARANKAMIYHYFGGKEDLYVAVLEECYAKIRGEEAALDLENLSPRDAMVGLINFTLDYFIANPQFIRLLNDENIHGAVHVKGSARIKSMHSPLVGVLERLVDHGNRDGVFARRVNPVLLYITIASLAYFYLSNSATLQTIFDRFLLSTEAVAAWRAHIIGVVLAFLETPGR
ncbi:MAG: TetR family transcriptional regulator [Alphaproteobacteria bacterium]